MSDFSDDDDIDDTTNSIEKKLESRFNAAANYVQQIHPNLTANQLLEIYGLYKQATLGKCNTAKPGGLFNLQAKSKWNSWNGLGDMTKIKAMEEYIDKITSFGWSYNNKTDKTQSWVCHSIHAQENDDVEIKDSDKTVFDYVKEINIEQLKTNLNTASINDLDETGLGLIHWATDRNATEILKFLLNNGANVNLQDVDKQTALHYASSCGHLDCLNILLSFGADRKIKDEDGKTCIDVAFDQNIQLILEN